MSASIALVQLVLYAAGAMLLYRAVFRLVREQRMSALAACLCYWAVLAVLPAFLTRATGVTGNYIYVNYPSVRVAAWDVGLAMWLFVSMWACYLFGLVAACLASWRLFQIARRGARERAT